MREHFPSYYVLMGYAASLIVIPLIWNPTSAEFGYLGKTWSSPEHILVRVDTPGEICDRNPNVFEFDFVLNPTGIRLCNRNKQLFCNYLIQPEHRCECHPTHLDDNGQCKVRQYGICEIPENRWDPDPCVYGNICIRPSNAPHLREGYGLCCTTISDCVFPTIVPVVLPPSIGQMCDYADFEKLIINFQKSKTYAERDYHRKELLELRKNPKYLVDKLCFDPELEYKDDGKELTFRFMMSCSPAGKCVCNADGEAVVIRGDMCLLSSDVQEESNKGGKKDPGLQLCATALLTILISSFISIKYTYSYV